MVQDLPALSYLQNKGLLQMSNWTWHGRMGFIGSEASKPGSRSFNLPRSSSSWTKSIYWFFRLGLLQPCLPIDPAELHELRSFAIAEFVGPSYTVHLVGPWPRAFVLAIVHRPAPRTTTNQLLNSYIDIKILRH
jgi:hypothetical protein